jgi:hypothetical protein
MIIDVRRDEFEAFKGWAGSNRFGWPAALSTNDWREAWPPTGWGYTPVDDRRRLHGRFPFVDQVVSEYLKQRPRGGRFFIDDGLIAYYKPQEEGNPRYAIALLRIVN